MLAQGGTNVMIAARRVLFVPIGVALLAAVLQAGAAQACVGDCDGSGEVTVDELIKGVNIALESIPISACPSFDRSGDGAVTIDELLFCVNEALFGCAAPTQTSTPVPTDT